MFNKHFDNLDIKKLNKLIVKELTTKEITKIDIRLLGNLVYRQTLTLCVGGVGPCQLIDIAQLMS
jgi:isocitrate dehydrogenase kinase/phosphatase